MLASFSSEPAAIEAGRDLMWLRPPRIVSLDEPEFVATFPADPTMPVGRFSLRAVIDCGVQTTVSAVVADHGGRVEAIRP